ncbi:MAG: hypothetical protein ABIJ47_13135 [Candidatus Bathyarchaeota archaeon]
MSSKVAHLDYEIRQIVCRAAKKTPAINTPGINIASVEEGHEFTTWFWAAKELVEAGLAEYSGEPLSQTEWNQVHFKERLNPAGPPGPLPDDFYAKAYQSFNLIKLDKAPNLSRMRARFKEILESRIGRIARMASAEADSPTSSLQKEEEQLYDMVHRLILAWREDLRGLGE